MSINELFGTETNARTLSGTAALTNISASVATDIIRKMEADIDNYRDTIALSAKDATALDELLNEFAPWIDGVPEELRDFDEATVDSMIKSQQSKRSRAKSKAMTLDNYRTLLTAAIAENLLREVYDRPKSATAYRGPSHADYTPAYFEELAADQQRLRKEIRNVQSKKSIMKSKAGFDPSSEAWQQLVTIEAQLKDLRVGGRGSSVVEVEVDHTKDALNELMEGVDPEHLKAADAKELLARIMELKK